MTIYTDGSAHPNPGPGGYGVLVFDDKNDLIDCFTFQTGKTTNNEQELKAIRAAFLKYGTKNDDFCQPPIIYSDSNYAVQTLNKWMFSWASNNWIKSDKKKPENLEIIKDCYNYYMAGFRMDLRYIKGHNSTLGNDLADKLATGKMTPSDVYAFFGKTVKGDNND
jgi:ribonuclease HI